MKSPKLFFAIIIACSLLACTKQDALTPVSNPETQLTVTDEANIYTPPALKNQKGITVNVNTNIGGYIEALPFDYAVTTKRYPMIVFLHGIGEEGSGSAKDLLQVARHSVPSLINNGLFPKTFLVGGTSYSFIVISPQFKNWPSATTVNDMISYAVKKYRVDESRIYITGLSMGGGVVMEYGAYYGNRIAAMVPMSECNGSSSTKAQAIAKSGVGVWAFHNHYDPRVNYLSTYNYINAINTYKPLQPAIKTIFEEKGHNSWTKASDPNYKENNLNIYQWMLKHKR